MPSLLNTLAGHPAADAGWSPKTRPAYRASATTHSHAEAGVFAGVAAEYGAPDRPVLTSTSPEPRSQPSLTLCYCRASLAATPARF